VIHSSESLQDKESITEGSATLTGYEVKSTGVEDAYVLISGGDKHLTIVCPAGERAALSGLSEDFPSLSVEKEDGDGTVVATVYYDEQASAIEPVEIELDD